jgi:hypothetical protein
MSSPSPSPRFRPFLVALASSSLLLAACSRDQPQAEVQDQAPPPVADADLKPDAAPTAAAVSGFTPLPTTNQVLAANAIGRSDPFASDRPVPIPIPGGRSGGAGSAAPSRPAPLQLPADFRFSGVIRSAGTPQALVQLGASSGSVGIGERGGRNTDLLPAGWVVSSIDVDRGRLVLRQGGQTVTAEL